MNLPSWLSPEEPYLLAISGGRDSSALLHLLLHHRFRRIVLCHLDHGLRPDSAEDAAFVRSLAEKHQLPIELEKADLDPHGAALETTARRVRYRFFARCASRHRCPRLLLAHHADDQAETILHNLLRGSSGLRGMHTRRVRDVDGVTLELMRPLLQTRRAEIEAYLRTHQIVYRDDPTNAEPITARNRLRHEVLPLLAEIAARDPVPALLRSAQLAREAELLLDATYPLTPHLDPQSRLHLRSLESLPTLAQKRILLSFLRQSGVPDLSEALLTRASALLHPGGPPALALPGGSRLRRRQARLFIESAS